VRVADVLIADAHDAQQRATLEQERAQIVRRTEEACMQQKWSADIRDCIIGSKVTADIQACQRKLQPIVTTGAGSGSAKARLPEKDALPPGTKLDEKTGKPVKIAPTPQPKPKKKT
jgi:hypothetical protein